MVRDVTHPFFGRTLRGAQAAARAMGHVVVLIDDNYGSAAVDGSVEILREGAVDGFLFFASDPPPSLRVPGAPPIVLVENEQRRLPFVRLDVETGTDAALAHLHALGHTRIGRVRSAVGGQTFDRRQARWIAHLQAHGQDPDAQVTVSSRFEADCTIAAGHAFLTHPDRPSAVLCDDDVLAAGLLAAAHQLGVDVPGEVAVVGFDDLDVARLTSPPLTTVRFDAEALGAAAFELLHARLQGKRPRNRVLPSELVIRASTAG